MYQQAWELQGTIAKHETQVDHKTGALNIKKGESWINTLTPIVIEM